MLKKEKRKRKDKRKRCCCCCCVLQTRAKRGSITFNFACFINFCFGFNLTLISSGVWLLQVLHSSIQCAKISRSLSLRCDRFPMSTSHGCCCGIQHCYFKSFHEIGDSQIGQSYLVQVQYRLLFDSTIVGTSHLLLLAMLFIVLLFYFLICFVCY